jgi:biopolymer transport protein ExbD
VSASRIHHRGPASVRANMTPMIDVVFLLIIFFLLVAQIQRARAVEMELPNLPDAAAAALEGDDRLIVNVLPMQNAVEAPGYRFEARTFAETPAGLAELAESVARELADRPAAMVVLRASARDTYDRVHPALQTLAAAGTQRVHLALTRDDADSGRPATTGGEQ